jgi:hypothetical protein
MQVVFLTSLFSVILWRYFLVGETDFLDTDNEIEKPNCFLILQFSSFIYECCNKYSIYSNDFPTSTVEKIHWTPKC